jgi:hypothetical protein
VPLARGLGRAPLRRAGDGGPARVDVLKKLMPCPPLPRLRPAWPAGASDRVG